MQLKIKKLLFDIQTSIESIEEYIGSIQSLEEYENNKMIRRAVERELEIIGEAVKNLLKLETSIEITDSRKIVNLRNFVIHSYDSVDNIIIWSLIENEIPQLKKEVGILLDK